MQDHSTRSETRRRPTSAASSDALPSPNARSRRKWLIGAIAVAAVGAGWTHRALHRQPIAAVVTPASAPEAQRPPLPSAAERVKRAPRAAARPIAAAGAKKDEQDHGDDLVVVPDTSTTGKVVWTKELDGITATLRDDGIIGYWRKLEPGETPVSGQQWSSKDMAVVDRLVAEAQEYSKTHLVTMPRRDYDQMVAAEDDERAFLQAQREAEIEAQLDKEGVRPDQRRAVAVVDHDHE